MRKLTGLLLILFVMAGVTEAAKDWHTEMVDDDGAVSEPCDLTLDSNGYPHIVY